MRVSTKIKQLEDVAEELYRLSFEFNLNKDLRRKMTDVANELNEEAELWRDVVREDNAE